MGGKKKYIEMFGSFMEPFSRQNKHRDFHGPDIVPGFRALKKTLKLATTDITIPGNDADDAGDDDGGDDGSGGM